MEGEACAPEQHITPDLASYMPNWKYGIPGENNMDEGRQDNRGMSENAVNIMRESRVTLSRRVHVGV